MRALQAAAQPPAAEMSFAAAMAAISATKASIAGLEGQLVSANATLAGQEANLRAVQAAADDLKASAAQLQLQIAATEQTQKMMTDAFMGAIIWILEESGKMKAFGGEVAVQAGVVDEETKKMLKLFADFSQGHSATTIADVQAAVAAWQAARDEIDRIAAGIKANTAGLGAPSIPGFATGGIVTRPTLAMLGERGPEAIVPLGAGGGFGGGFGGATPRTGDVYLDGQKVGRVVWDDLKHRAGVGFALGLA